jgi:hypothetical protein
MPNGKKKKSVFALIATVNAILYMAERSPVTGLVAVVLFLAVIRDD